MIYLDNAATSAKKPICVYMRLFKESIFTGVNAGRGAHRKSLRAMRGINAAAEAVAELFNINDSSRIAFLPNASYALNLAILSILKPEDHVITTVLEHNSVLRPIARFGNFTIVPVDNQGYVNPIDIENAIKPNTKLIVCTHVSNVCGAIQPVKKIGEIANKYGIHFLLDAAQSAGAVEINAKEIGADIIAFSGHKGLLGPLGTGGLYVADDTQILPVITGGTGSLSESLFHPTFMPDAFQIGTMNTPAIMALETAVKCIELPQQTHMRESELARRFIDDLKSMEEVQVLCDKGCERNGTVSFRIAGIDSSEVEEFLDVKKGIIVRSGMHCAPLAHKAFNTFDSGTVRVSFGYYSTDYERMAVTDAIYQFIKEHK